MTIAALMFIVVHAQKLVAYGHLKGRCIQVASNPDKKLIDVIIDMLSARAS